MTKSITPVSGRYGFDGPSSIGFVYRVGEIVFRNIWAEGVEQWKVEVSTDNSGGPKYLVAGL